MDDHLASVASATSLPQRVPGPLGALSVRVVGHGPRALVLWPSILCDAHIFDALADRLAAEARLVLIDGPGHGDSPGPDREFTAAEAGRAMLAVMDHLNLPRAVVGGVSWGGLTAAEVALSAPDRVAGLILMNTPMDIDGARPLASNRAIAFGARWLAGWPVFRRGVAKSFFTEQALRDDPLFAERFHRMLRQADRRRLAEAVRSVILRGVPLRGRLAALRVPTLLIAGIDDAMYPLDRQAEAALSLADGRFVPVAGRHISPVDAPGAVAAAIGDFLRETVSR